MLPSQVRGIYSEYPTAYLQGQAATPPRINAAWDYGRRVLDDLGADTVLFGVTHNLHTLTFAAGEIRDAAGAVLFTMPQMVYINFPGLDGVIQDMHTRLVAFIRALPAGAQSAYLDALRAAAAANQTIYTLGTRTDLGLGGEGQVGGAAFPDATNHTTPDGGYETIVSRDILSEPNGQLRFMFELFHEHIHFALGHHFVSAANIHANVNPVTVATVHGDAVYQGGYDTALELYGDTNQNKAALDEQMSVAAQHYEADNWGHILICPARRARFHHGSETEVEHAREGLRVAQIDRARAQGLERVTHTPFAEEDVSHACFEG